MVHYKAPLKEYEFIYNDLLDLQQYSDLPGFEELESFPDMLEMAKDFFENELLPLNVSGDKQGAQYDPKTKTVTLPDGHVEAYQKYCENGFPAINADPEYGGLGMPNVLNSAIGEMMCSTNMAWGLLPGLSHGAYSAIHEHASDELKARFLPKMVTGEWTGVMGLTEPEYGSDLPGMKAKAVPTGDGTYKITGEKIFISCGDQNATDNIIHLVLAKLPDDPEGKVSLFLVPKVKVNEQGENTDQPNSLYAAGLEEKMGIHACPTATMVYEEAEGYLVGEPSKGMNAMFTMMNEARLGVGMQGLGVAETAYQSALDYAVNRVQGTHIDDMFNKNAKNCAIIEHEDVRRMLLEMRSIVEGGRVLSAQTALQIDISHNHPDEAERAKAKAYIDLMTPIVKAMTDDYYDVTDNAVQVLGGHGFVSDQGVEQLQRDARITRIYEGTNGIQAKDLTMRKVLQNAAKNHNGDIAAAIAPVLDPIRELVAQHAGNEAMADYIQPLADGLKSLEEATQSLMANAQGGLSNVDAASTPYLKLFTKVALGGVWAQQAAKAQEKLKAEGLSADDQAFYEAKLVTAGFYQNMTLAKEHAALKDRVVDGKRWLPDLPDVAVAHRKGMEKPAPANDNIADIVAKGPKSATDHAQRASGEISR